MQSSISNNQNFKIHSKINRKPMKGLKHGSNVGPPAGPSQKPWSHILYNLYLIHGRFVQTVYRTLQWSNREEIKAWTSIFISFFETIDLILAMFLRWKKHERNTDFTWLLKHKDLSKMTPKFLMSLQSEDDRPPITCLILGVMLSGAIIITSVLSVLSCKKLSAIHLLMETKQFCKRDSLSSLSGLNEIYNWMSSA